MDTLKGIPVSAGIAIGEVFKYVPYEPQLGDENFPPEEKNAQLERLKAAVEGARAELQKLAASMDDPEKGKIFKAHEDFLDDEVMFDEILDSIKGENTSPDHAVFSVYSTYMKVIGKAKDPLIRERAADLQDVRNRIIRNLQGIEEKNLSRLPGPRIVLAHDLFPSDTATIDRANVIGVATEIGGNTSHSAIIAKSYGIPAVLGVGGLMNAFTDGEHIIMDAVKGCLIPNPGDAVLAEYNTLRELYLKDMEQADKFIAVKAETNDGVQIDVGLNIGSAMPSAEFEFCDFVGLLRTEFLYMEKIRMPTEEEQYDSYKAILTAMKGKPVTLRTLDIGGDKKLSYLPLPHEDNPFLGERALRLCFSHPDLFTTQLRAALRASVHGSLQIMFPMVGSMEDWRRAIVCLNAVRKQLDDEGVAYSRDIKVGIMIEIPSAAIIADKLAAEVDFASIGSNDLCQYLFAVDRMNPSVEEYYQEFSPALFRTMEMAVSAFNRAGKPISICGEQGGNPLAAPILIGIGMRKLSMSASSFGKVKRVISGISVKECESLARKVLAMDTEQEVKEAVQEFIKRG